MTSREQSVTSSAEHNHTSKRDEENELVRELARAKLPTSHGEFVLVAFVGSDDERLDHVALIRGDIEESDEPIPVRVHSECVTGDVFGSLRCDCGDQLHAAMERISQNDRGILLYMRQEGRGIGIANKVAAYALQDEGLDTVDANRHLGFDDDMRRYDVAAGMLKVLGVQRIQLHTNNPNKVEGLRQEGIVVVGRMPLVVPVREENRFYLATKQTRSGHWLDVDE